MDYKPGYRGNLDVQVSYALTIANELYMQVLLCMIWLDVLNVSLFDKTGLPNYCITFLFICYYIVRSFPQWRMQLRL